MSVLFISHGIRLFDFFRLYFPSVIVVVILFCLCVCILAYLITCIYCLFSLHNECRKQNKKIKKELTALSDLHTTTGATDFKIDLSDDRFSALVLGDSRYGIDPTSTLFKKTTGMKEILEAQRHNSLQKESSSTTSNNIANRNSKNSNHDASTQSAAAAAMINSTNTDEKNIPKFNTKGLADRLKRKFSHV
jgi:hypothetical protein